MISRNLEQILRKSLADYPVVTIFGPRQSGKTTLAKMVCPDYEYVTLEDRETRDLALSDYKAFFSRHRGPLIIDEIQRVPEIVSAIQVEVDKDRTRNGRFVLTGSQQTELAAAVDESLAGRTSVLDLLPLSLSEIGDAVQTMSTDALMLRGFMPELYRTRKDATDYYRNYFRTYLERDVRKLVNVKDLILFERFVTLLAGRIGQMVNFSSLANETGVSSTTIASWMSVLESSFLIYRLPPHYTNIAKRVSKSPKIYFTDVGLAAYLLGLEEESQVSRDPLRGQLFENMVVMDACKEFTNRGRDPRMAVYRTEKGFEVDLIVSHGSRVRPIEIKSAMTFNGKLVTNLQKYADDDPLAENPLLVYDGDAVESFGPQGVSAVNFRYLFEKLRG